MKKTLLFILLILSIASQSFAWALTKSTDIGVTLANPGARTSFTTYDWIYKSGTSANNLCYASSGATNLTVTSAPTTIILTRSGGTQTATATVVYRIDMTGLVYPNSPVDGISAGLGSIITMNGQSYYRVSVFISGLTFSATPVTGNYISASQTYSMLGGTTNSVSFTVNANVKNDTFAVTELQPIKLTFNRKLPANPSCYSGDVMNAGINGDNCFVAQSASTGNYGVVSIIYPAGTGNVSARIVSNNADNSSGSSAGVTSVFTNSGGATISMKNQIMVSNLIASTNVATVQSTCVLNGSYPASAPTGTAGGIASWNNPSAGTYSFCWMFGAEAGGPGWLNQPITFSNTATGTYHASYTLIIDSY